MSSSQSPLPVESNALPALPPVPVPSPQDEPLKAPRGMKHKLRVHGRADFQSYATQSAFLQIALKMERLLELPKARIPQRSTKFSDESLARYIDPDQPTIGLSLSQRHNEMGLVAVAAQELRRAGEKVPNIVFMAPDCVCASFVRAGAAPKLFCKRGVVIDADGKWAEGRFPAPVRIDLIGSFSAEESGFLRKAEAFGLPLINPPTALRIGADKAQTKSLVEQLGISTPNGIVLTSQGAEDLDALAIKAKLDAFLSAGGLREVVVKPISGKGGKWISFHASTELEEMTDAVEEVLAAHPQGAIVEERVRSYQAHDRRGERCDWNLRVLVGAGGIIDWEARVNRWGKAVNKHKGAKVLEVDYVLEKMTDLLPAQRAALRAEVDRVSLAIAKKLDAGLLGLDFIWSETGKLWILEINSAVPGAMGSLAELRGDRADKLRAPSAFVHTLRSHPALNPAAVRGEIRGEDTMLFDTPFDDAVVQAEFSDVLAKYLDRERDAKEARDKKAAKPAAKSAARSKARS